MSEYYNAIKPDGERIVVRYQHTNLVDRCKRCVFINSYCSQLKCDKHHMYVRLYETSKEAPLLNICWFPNYIRMYKNKKNKEL